MPQSTSDRDVATDAPAVVDTASSSAPQPDVIAAVTAPAPAARPMSFISATGGTLPVTTQTPSWQTLFTHPGVHLSFVEITDASSGSGAMSSARALRSHSNIALAVALDSLIGTRGLSLFAQYKSKSGRNGSGEASFIQNYSNIVADDFNAFGEVWREQRAFSDRVRVKAGRIDFNTEFAGTDNGADFLNASMGYSPTITAAPTFPLPTTGANLIVSPRGSMSVSVGVFDGRDGAPAPEGKCSLFEIAQLRDQWAIGAAQLGGKLGIGVWRHTGLFSVVDAPDGSEPSLVGTHGWYATLDQTLWQGRQRGAAEDPRATRAAFAQYGRSDPRAKTVQAHHGGGFTLSGLLATRASDRIGVGFTHAGWLGGREVIGEAFYQLPVTSHLSFVGDVQRVSRRDALPERRAGTVSTLRTIVSF